MENKSETFYSKKHIDNLTIAIFSDIHYYPNFNEKTFIKIENQLKNNKPNYITILGDLLDDSKYNEFDTLIAFIKRITIIAPTIIIIGNHDEKTGKRWNWHYLKNTKLIQSLKEIKNVHLLNDETWTDKNITFYGFNLSYSYYENEKESYESFYKEAKQLKAEFPNSTYNITLCHSPINIYKFIESNPEHNLNKSDLILSGHMHNGCLPFWLTNLINKIFKSNRSIIAPKKSLFPKYGQGRVYEPKNGYIYEGITKLSYSTGFLHFFDFIYQKKVKFLKIKKR